MPLTLSDWSDIAQIGATLLTLIGVGASIWIAVRTLREVDHDRKLRHKPYLAFVPGGHRLPISFAKGDGFIPGVNRQYANKVLSHLSKNGESVVLNAKGKDGARKPCLYGSLHNYGAGAALGVTVTWVPERVWIGKESFEVTSDKLKDPLYDALLNCVPSVPSHIEPGQSSPLSRLPAFIVKDYDKKITQVDGHFLIACSDIFESKHVYRQDFHFFTHYGDDPPAVHVTFSTQRSGA